MKIPMGCVSSKNGDYRTMKTQIRNFQQELAALGSKQLQRGARVRFLDRYNRIRKGVNRRKFPNNTEYRKLEELLEGLRITLEKLGVMAAQTPKSGSKGAEDPHYSVSTYGSWEKQPTSTNDNHEKNPREKRRQEVEVQVHKEQHKSLTHGFGDEKNRTRTASTSYDDIFKKEMLEKNIPHSQNTKSLVQSKNSEGKNNFNNTARPYIKEDITPRNIPKSTSGRGRGRITNLKKENMFDPSSQKMESNPREVSVGKLIDHDDKPCDTNKNYEKAAYIRNNEQSIEQSEQEIERSIQNVKMIDNNDVEHKGNKNHINKYSGYTSMQNMTDSLYEQQASKTDRNSDINRDMSHHGTRQGTNIDGGKYRHQVGGTVVHRQEQQYSHNFSGNTRNTCENPDHTKQETNLDDGQSRHQDKGQGSYQQGQQYSNIYSGHTMYENQNINKPTSRHRATQEKNFDNGQLGYQVRGTSTYHGEQQHSNSFCEHTQKTYENPDMKEPMSRHHTTQETNFDDGHSRHQVSTYHQEQQHRNSSSGCTQKTYESPMSRHHTTQETHFDDGQSKHQFIGTMPSYREQHYNNSFPGNTLKTHENPDMKERMSRPDTKQETNLSDGQSGHQVRGTMTYHQEQQHSSSSSEHTLNTYESPEMIKLMMSRYHRVQEANHDDGQLGHHQAPSETHLSSYPGEKMEVDDYPETEEHQRTEYTTDTKKKNVTEEVVEQPALQILDVHQYFRDDFDVNSIDDSLDHISKIEILERAARSYENKVEQFSEEKFSLEYFVLDEKLMRLIEKLDKIKCHQDQEASQRKIAAIAYIKSLHTMLDERAKED